MLLLRATKVSAEWGDGQVPACTFHPWRFGFEGSTACEAKIALLIERSGCRTGCHCVCSIHVRFYLFFSVLRGIVCAKGVHKFILGHSEMI